MTTQSTHDQYQHAIQYYKLILCLVSTVCLRVSRVHSQTELNLLEPSTVQKEHYFWFESSLLVLVLKSFSP